MKLETMAHLTTIIGVPIAIIVPIAIAIAPWMKKKLKVWWNKTRDRTEFTLGYKTKLGQSETRSSEYTIGYVFVRYKMSYGRRFIHWKYDFLCSFYKRIGKLRKFENIANQGFINTLIKSNMERLNTGDGSVSYIYREAETLAFYPIKEFDNTPDWADLPYIEPQIKTYFKRYETGKQNQYDIRNGNKWLTCEELAEGEWLGIARENAKHNQDPLMPERKKIERFLEKGIKKQFETYKIGDTVCIRRRIGR